MRYKGNGRLLTKIIKSLVHLHFFLLSAKQLDMGTADIKHRTKKQELEGARRVLFLLNVLEKREGVRMKRMCDMGGLVDVLR